MSFDIARTSTLQAVATEDDRELAQDLRRRVEEAIAAAEAEPEVTEAVEAQRAAEENLAKLRQAERTLSEFTKRSREYLAAAAQSAMETIVETAASGKPEFKETARLSAIENRNRQASRAIEHIVERLIPGAQIASLRLESHALMAQARAIEGAAQKRAEKLLGQIREAVTEEMILPVDLSKGVAGALLAHAAGLRKRAAQIAVSAEEIDRACEARQRVESGRNA
ncbi:MAG: hypothetical protein ACRD30_07945 [Bryobacteraceae bacterium]